MTRACRLITWCLVLIICSPALAQSTKTEPNSAERAEASRHFRRGVEFFQEEAFRAALLEFQRAYDIAPDYRLLHNIAQAALRLQDYLTSVRNYEAFLAAGGAEIAADRRQEVEAALTSLRERIGRIAVTSNRAGAEVVIDDQKVGTTPLPVAVAVNVGRHRVFVRAADGASESKLVDVVGGDIAEVDVSLAATPVARVNATTAATERSAPWSAQRKAAVASWSVGALALGASAVTGVLTWNAQSDLDALLETQPVNQQSLANQRDSLKTLALSTDVLIGAGALAVVVGTVLWFVDRRSDKMNKTRSRNSAREGRSPGLWVAGDSVHLRGEF